VSSSAVSIAGLLDRVKRDDRNPWIALCRSQIVEQAARGFSMWPATCMGPALRGWPRTDVDNSIDGLKPEKHDDHQDCGD
jgi:hypothetical protein